VKTKECTKCHQQLPDTEEFFHLDKAKVRLGHFVVLSAACKKCKNEARKPVGKARRKALKEKGSSEYRLKKARDPNYLAKFKERQKRYKDRINERNRIRYQTKEEVRDYHRKHRSALHQKEADEPSDYYVARLITKRAPSLNPMEIKLDTELIETQRAKTKLHRMVYPEYGNRKHRQIPSE